MHVQVGGNFSVDRLQELLELDRAVAGAQAVEFLAPLAPDIEAVAVAIRDGSIVAAAETQIGELR